MPLAVEIAALALFVVFLLEALVRVRREGVPRADLPIWIALGGFVFAMSLLSADLAREATLRYHGAAFLALTLGYGRALPTVGAIVAATSAPGTLGSALLVDALVPIWLTCSLVALSRRHLPPNPFVFLLGCAFFGIFAVGALQLALGTAATAWLGADGGTMALPASERLLFGLLLAAGEATLEGMLISVLVVYAPRAVRLFDDRFYLARP